MLLFLPYTVLSQSVLLGLRFIHNSVFFAWSNFSQIASFKSTYITKCSMPRQRRNINRRNAALDGANVSAEPTDYSAMSTEALRLMLGERHLQQTGNRRELISRLQQNEHQRLPASQSASALSNSSVASGETSCFNFHYQFRFKIRLTPRFSLRRNN